MSESNNLPQAISHKKLSYLMLKAQKDSHFSDELAEIESSEQREFEELINNWEASTKKVVNELSKRWKPILDHFDNNGVDLCYEIHPGEDLHDGVTFEMFLERVGNHKRCNMLFDPSHYVLQHLDYLAHIDIYHEKIKMFHVKDAELNPSGKQGVYGGFQSWVNRAGRFRSLGDGQVDFKSIFSKLTSYDYDGWAVLEWECCLKHPEDGAREGAEFIKNHIINTTEKAFDDFAGSGADHEANKKMLGIN